MPIIPNVITRSKRRSISLFIHPNGDFEVRLPLKTPLQTATDFIAKKEAWLYKNIQKAKQSWMQKPNYSNQEISELKKKAKYQIPNVVQKWSAEMQAKFNQIRIKNTKTRWGSCSSKNNLNFHYKLILFPPEVLEYVVIHELAHVFQKNHSAKFWKIVEEYCPNYKLHRNWLKTEGQKW